MAKTEKLIRISAIQEDFVKLPDVSQTDIADRNTFRHNVSDWKADQGV